MLKMVRKLSIMMILTWEDILNWHMFRCSKILKILTLTRENKDTGICIQRNVIILIINSMNKLKHFTNSMSVDKDFIIAQICRKALEELTTSMVSRLKEKVKKIFLYKELFMTKKLQKCGFRLWDVTMIQSLKMRQTQNVHLKKKLINSLGKWRLRLLWWTNN